MSLTEQTVTIGSWLEDGQIQVKRITYILEDGIRIAERLPHRHVIEPGQDVSTEDSRVQQVCSVLWTTKVIEDYVLAKSKL